MKPARVCLTDLPRPYNSVREIRHDGGTTKYGMGASTNYNHGCMSCSDLVKLGEAIQHVVTLDAYLLHWVTMPNIPFDAKLLGETGSPGLWGCCFKTVPFSWTKRNKVANTQFCAGSSYGFANKEDVWLARYPGSNLWHSNKTDFTPSQIIWSEEMENGKLRVFTDPSVTLEIFEPHPRYPLKIRSPEWDVNFPGTQFITCPPHMIIPHTQKKRCKKCRTCRTGKIAHSRKPETIQDLIGAWLNPYLNGYPKLELFATRDREEWICLGYDVTGNDIFDDLEELTWQIVESGHFQETAYYHLHKKDWCNLPPRY